MSHRPFAIDIRRDARIAKALGVTPTGLRVLAKMVADPDGVWRGGLTSGNPGTSRGPLIAKGLISDGGRAHDCDTTITDAGREIVRRARAMGW